MRPIINLFAAAAAVITMLAVFLAGAMPAWAHAGMGAEPLDPEVSGTYRLADEQILTLTGTAGMPSYEVGGRRVFLRADGHDRYVAWREPEHVLEIVRGAGDTVSGLRLQQLSGTVAGTRVALYDELDVEFRNGEVILAGSIVMPAGAGPHPAVVIVHGAEAATRESYRLMASHFARRGVAALIYDKRGIGHSGGSFRQASFKDLVGDALASLRLLRASDNIDAEQVGMLGLSQGGWIIAMAAVESDEVAFLIPISTSGFSPAVQDRWLNGNIVAHRDLAAGINRASERAWRMLLSTRDLVDAGLLAPMPDVPGFWFHALDPHLDTGALWQAVRQPLLGVWGEFDCQLPAHDSMIAIRAALDAGGHANYTLTILPRADHSITLVEPCAQETTGWGVLAFDYPDDYFGLLAAWIHDHRDAAEPVRKVITPDTPTPSNLRWHQAPTAGVGLLGSFVPQMAMIVVMLVGFTLFALAWPVQLVAAYVRRRPVRSSSAGPLAVVGAVATLAAVVSLAELLLLGSPEGMMFVGSRPVLGASPLFLTASVLTVVATVGGAAVATRRFVARADGARPARGEIVVLVFIGLLAVWATYWNFVPVWSLLA
jgi:uncharacterized protein